MTARPVLQGYPTTKDSSAEVPRLGRWIALGPGAVLSCYAVALMLGARFDGSPRDSFWQYVPAAELASDPLMSLWHFHAQPPSVNAVFLVTDRLGSAGVLVQQMLLLAVAMALVMVIGDIVLVWTRSRRAALATSVLAGIMPSTTFYALWLYPTLPVAFLLATTVWGLVRGGVSGARLPLVLSALGITSLFLLRATLIWPVALAWLAIVVRTALVRPEQERRPGRVVAATAVICLMIIGLFTVKNLVLFDSPTQSSWSKENYANVLMNVMTDEQRGQVAGTDPCLAELIDVGTFQPVDSYPVCRALGGPRGPKVSVAVLDEQRWSNGRINYNHRDRLLLSARWGELVEVTLGKFPGLVLKVLRPIQVNGGHRWGTPVLLFGPSTRYIFVKDNIERLGWVGRTWAIAMGWVPPLALLMWIGGLTCMVLVGGWRRSPALGYLLVSALLAALTGAYLFLEFGENQRFQVELVYVWIALGAAGAHRLLQEGPVRERSRARKDKVLEQSTLARDPAGKWNRTMQ